MKSKAEIKAVINSRPKGAIVTLEGARPAKVFKKCPDLIVKHSVFQMRVGHNYYAQKAVKEKHESGERQIADPEKLWHKKSKEGLSFREHKRTGEVYVMGQPTGNKSQVRWFRNGKEVPYSDVELDLKSEEKRSDKPDQLTYKFENLLDAR